MSLDKNALLPSSANKSERALSLATRFSDDIVPEDIKKLWRPDEVPAKFLPFIAWGMHVDFWRDDMPEEVKRTLIKSSFEWHRYKGTKWAVEEALRNIGLDPNVIPWFDIPDGQPYTFAVRAKILDDYYIKNDKWNDLIKIVRNAIDVSKSARDGLVWLKTYLEDEAKYNIYHGIADLRGGYHRISPPRPEFTPSKVSHGIGTYNFSRPRVSPARPKYDKSTLFQGILTGQGKIMTINPAPGEFNPQNPLVHIHGYTLGHGVATGTGVKVFVSPSRPKPEAQIYYGIASGVACFMTISPALGEI